MKIFATYKQERLLTGCKDFDNIQSKFYPVLLHRNVEQLLSPESLRVTVNEFFHSNVFRYHRPPSIDNFFPPRPAILYLQR